MKNCLGLGLKLIICFCLILSTSGCWNRRELPTLAIVMGVGIDKAQEPDKLQLTVQIVKPGELKTATKEEGGGSSKAYWNLKNTGDTVFDTIRGFSDKSGRGKLFWSHNQVLIISRDIAEEGVHNYIDFFVRDHETRLGVLVLVSKDEASEVLDVQPELEKIPAMNIDQLVEGQDATSYSSQINLQQFITRLMSKTTAPIAPLIEVSGQGKEKKLIVSGTAVFKQDKLVGQLNKSETRGLLWVIDEVKSGIIDVDCPSGTGKVSLEILRAKSKIKPEIIDDKIIIKLEIKEEGTIGSQSCPENLALPPIVAALEKELSAIIESEVMAALKKARQLNTDIFGFGDVVHQKYPKEWKDLEESWDEIFPDIEVELTIEAKLRRSGRISSPAVPAKE